MRELERELRRGGARRRPPRLRPERQRGGRRRRPAADLGRLGAAARARARWRWSRRAATSPSTRSARAAGSASTPWSRPATRPSSTPATGSAALAEADGVGSVALFLEADGDGATLAEALARCAERRIGVAVLKVGASAAGARAAAAHTGALAGDQRVFRALVEEAGAAWARRPARAARAGAAPWPSRGRGPAARVASPSSPARAATRGSPPTRPRRSAPSCPGFRRRPRERLEQLLPRRGDDRQPARLHRADLGRHRSSAADRRRGRRRPGDRPAAAPLTTTRRVSRPSHEAELGGGARRASPPERRETDAGGPVRVDPARPDR